MSITPTPAELAWLDQEDQRIARTVRRYGVSLEHVWGKPEHERPTFTYTIGLFGVGHPELLVFSLGPDTAAWLLNGLAERVRAGEDFLPGSILDIPTDAPSAHRRIRLEVVPNPGEIVFGANRFAERPPQFSVPVLQITWTDEAGRFPEDEGYAHPRWEQPRPGAFRA